MFILENKHKPQLLAGIMLFFAALSLRKYFVAADSLVNSIELMIYSLFMLVLLPFLVIKTIYHEKLSEFKLRLNVGRKKILLSLFLTLPLFAAIGLLVLKFDLKQWDRFFVVSDWVLSGIWVVVFINLFILPLIVLGIEFFFRGYIQSMAEKSWSPLPAVIFSSVLCVFYIAFFDKDINIYWGKEQLLNNFRLVFLLAMNLILGIIAYLTRSIFISALFNWIFMLIFDFVVVFRIIELQK